MFIFGSFSPLWLNLGRTLIKLWSIKKSLSWWTKMDHQYWITTLELTCPDMREFSLFTQIGLRTAKINSFFYMNCTISYTFQFLMTLVKFVDVTTAVSRGRQPKILNFTTFHSYQRWCNHDLRILPGRWFISYVYR